MKIKKVFLLTIVILSIFLQACNIPRLNSTQKITAPKNKLTPIHGTWEIVDYKIINNISQEPNKSLIGQRAEFSSSAALLSDEVCRNPEYKVKVVDTKNYLFHNYKVDYKELGITKSTVEIISVTSKDKLFYDFIRVNEKTLLLYMDGTFFTLNKLSDATSNLSKMGPGFKYGNKSPKKDSLLRSGIFIALRSNSSDIKNSPSTYRTIWIPSINREIGTIVESNGIFAPRKSGFWFLDVDRINSKDIVEDNITAYAVDSKEKKSSKVMNSPIEIPKENLYRNIVFICNDYLATEYSLGNIKSNTLNKLQVLPIDNPNNKKGIKISDLVGEVGLDLLKDSISTFLSIRNDKKDVFEKQPPDEENFTLVRRNGHWIMNGRMNSPVDPDKFINFDLNMFPPKKLLNYDELYVSWNDIKSRLPYAIDAFISPNADIALIVCKDTMYIYSIKDKILSEKPIGEVSIDEKESIIMAEWATGDYVEKWKESFDDFIKSKKNNK